MDLEEIGINAGNWVHSAQDRNYWSPCERGIEPPGSISHGVSKYIKTKKGLYLEAQSLSQL